MNNDLMSRVQDMIGHARSKDWRTVAGIIRVRKSEDKGELVRLFIEHFEHECGRDRDGLERIFLNTAQKLVEFGDVDSAYTFLVYFDARTRGYFQKGIDAAVARAKKPME